MTFFFVIALIVALAALAPRYGADSRNLRDHPWKHHAPHPTPKR